MSFRLLALVFAWGSVFTAIVCLARLGFDDWPVVIKYSKWQYILKVVFNTIFAGAVFWAAYR